MALVKVVEVSLYAIASVTSNTGAPGSSVDVSTYYGCSGRIRMGRGTGTAFTTAPILRVQAAFVASPTENQWVTVAPFQPAVGASIGSQAVSGTVNAGATSVALAAGTNFAAGDYVFFHNGTILNSEWSRVQSISGSTLTLEAGLVNAQTGATCRNQAEEYPLNLDLTSVQKLRFYPDGYGTGQAFIVEVGFGAVSAL